MRVIFCLPLLVSLTQALSSPPTAQVYLLPAGPNQQHNLAYTPALNQFDANLLISHHLGFDAYQAAEERSATWWNEMARVISNSDGSGNRVGEGPKDSVLIVIQSDYPQDFIPESTMSHPSFTIENPPPADMFTDLIHAYVERAHQMGDSVFSSLAPAINSITKIVSPVYKSILDAFDIASAGVEKFVTELEMLAGLVDEDTKKDAVSTAQEFSAFEVTGLVEIQKEKGRESEQYLTAAKSMQAVLSSPALQTRNTVVIVVPVDHTVTTTSSRRSKRQQQPLLPSHPIAGPVFSVSTCFASNTTCAEKTKDCSGHGSCSPTTRAGKTCYTCSCAVTKNEQGRRQWWAGSACEKLDLSTSFTLLAGSSIFLVVLVVFAIGLLYSIGGEQLPNTLTAGAVSGHAKRD
ncbi:hypothetical protein FRB95_002724 [Tulasnella sp. JGI-2019a]|nr:hypothetical protein FRB95_002724 [Tulasnella sp. JGI-2019a]